MSVETKGVAPLKKIGRASSRLGRAAMPMAMLVGVVGAGAGCRVNSDDLHRWETTVNGPDKLVAVLTHDKYDKELRVEAAWSLVDMKKRSGQSVGLTRLLEELEKLEPKERKDIVAGLWKRLKDKVNQPLQKTDKGMADPTVTFKDATFAIYTDEKIDLDPAVRDAMTQSLVEWAVGKDGDKPEDRLAQFEARMDNTAQAYGVEQVLRRLGIQAAKKLPTLLSAKTAIKSMRLDSIARVMNDSKPTKAGDPAFDAMKDEASKQYARILDGTLGGDYVDAVRDETVAGLKAVAGGKDILDNAEKLKKYTDAVRDARLTWLFPILKTVGRKAVVDKLVELAKNDKETKEHRALALAALDGNVDTSSDSQLKDFVAIAKSSAPDEVKSGALGRIGAYPPDQAVKAYYEFFDAPNWKVRYDGASAVLIQMQKVGDKTKTTAREFLSRLPSKPDQKMGLGEPSSYGTELAKLPAALDPKPAIAEALSSKSLGAQLTALGWYYANGTKADLSLLEKASESKDPIFKCKDDDDCGWDKPGCPVPKAGNPNETENKPVATVGDYVNYCVKPAIEARAKAPPADNKK